MPEPSKTDDVEKFLAEQKSFEDRKQELIDDLLRQKAEAMKTFDEKLAKLGHRASSAKVRRSHHKQAQPDPAAKTTVKSKPQ